MIAKTHVDKEIFRRCLQDEARHVSYGVLELKNYLATHTDRTRAVEEMHRFADIGEQVILSAFTEAALVELIAVLLAGGLKQIDKGMEGLGHMWRMFIDEYLQRCATAGFDRRERCTIPLDLPWESPHERRRRSDCLPALLFPSRAWFQRLADLMNAHRARQEQLGYVDCIAQFTVLDGGAEGGPLAYRVTFEEFSALDVEEVATRDLGNADFALEDTSPRGAR